ncbi:MAG: NAD-binding protein [Thermoleophilia bacterium]
MTSSYSHHHIVCGFDAVGAAVARELRGAGAVCVVLDPGADAGERASILGLPFRRGVPSDAELLAAAGIAGARSLVACEESDDANLATVAAARALRADLEIVARATGDRSADKLRRAGAQRVISPERAGGVELARLALHPPAGDPRGPGYRVAEVAVGARGAGAGHAIGVVRGGAFVIGLRRANGWFVPLPPDDMLLRPGDQVMALGTAETIELLERLVLSEAGPAPSGETLGLPRTSRRL